MVAAAKRAKVPVVVHYDHGLTFDRCIQALKLGFSSIMFDGSAGEAEQNLKDTAEIVKIAHSFGATVEGEIGHVGTLGAGDVTTDNYTTPKEAIDFIENTGVDALAIAIGTAHGAYKEKPKLDIERLKAIRQKVETPLVLHGASGLTDEDFCNTIKNGIAKMNIFTDLCLAGIEGMQEGLSKNLSYLEIRDLKVSKIKEAVKEKIRLFGSENKA
jgi:fructose-bisphosphate aldolase class II